MGRNSRIAAGAGARRARFAVVPGPVLPVRGGCEDRDGQYRLERACGSFFRAVPLPEGVKPPRT
jgi:hypothetical protein